MSPRRELVMRGSVVSEHLVHLFDEPQSLAQTVAAHLCDGWRRDDTLLVIARAANWELTAAELAVLECPVSVLIASGRLLVRDAATTLAGFLVNGQPDRGAFHESVGDLVQRLCRESPSGLTVYSEMVDILAEQRNFIADERLETLWGDLAAECSFRILCGYSSAHFGDERTDRHLDRICTQHTHDGVRSSDLLGTWLLANRRSNFHVAP